LTKAEKLFNVISVNIHKHVNSVNIG
jgi:hypothetical protein